MDTKKTSGLLLLLMAFIFLGCEEHNPNQDPPYDGPPKENIITAERAKEIYDTYSERRVPIIQDYEGLNSDSTKFNPSRYVEYDYKTIKQYIAYIEHEAKDIDVEITGLRFYFSNYPASDKFPNGDAVKYPKQNTMFIVPTMAYNGKHVGFLIDETDGKRTAVPISERVDNDTVRTNQGKVLVLPKSELNYAGFFTSNTNAVNGTVSLILNDGALIPPPQQKTDFGE